MAFGKFCPESRPSPLPWGEVDARSAAGEGMLTIDSPYPSPGFRCAQSDLSPWERSTRVRGDYGGHVGSYAAFDFSTRTPPPSSSIILLSSFTSA